MLFFSHPEPIPNMQKCIADVDQFCRDEEARLIRQTSYHSRIPQGKREGTIQNCSCNQEFMLSGFSISIFPVHENQTQKIVVFMLSPNSSQRDSTACWRLIGVSVALQPTEHLCFRKDIFVRFITYSTTSGLFTTNQNHGEPPLEENESARFRQIVSAWCCDET